jgi:hypothetical protein
MLLEEGGDYVQLGDLRITDCAMKKRGEPNSAGSPPAWIVACAIGATGRSLICRDKIHYRVSLGSADGMGQRFLVLVRLWRLNHAKLV